MPSAIIYQVYYIRHIDGQAIKKNVDQKAARSLMKNVLAGNITDLRISKPNN